MNEERSFERFVADSVAGTSQGIPLPDDFYDDMHSFATSTGQHPEWLALIKEPPMRTNSRTTVGSPTARVMAILAATLMLIAALAGAGAGAQRLLAADGPIVVAQDGSGDYETITEAIEAAEAGDEVVVKPGTYAESITVDKDITLRGQDRDRVVIGPAGEVLVTLVESSGEIADLTLRGKEDTQGMSVQGGAPTITGIIFDGTGRPFDGNLCVATDCGGSLALEGANAHVSGNRFVAGGEVGLHGGSAATIEDNVFEGGPHLYLESIGPDVIVRGNHISGTLDRGIGMSSPGNVLIEDNHLSGLTGVGIRVGQNTGAEGYEPTIRGNIVEGADRGIEVTESGAPLIEGNELSGNGYAIVSTRAASDIVGNTMTDNVTGMSLGAGGAVADNTITGGRTGIVLTGGAAQLSGNSVEGASNRGIAIGSDATPTLRDNRACGNGENLWIADTADPDIDDSNEVCDDGLIE